MCFLIFGEYCSDSIFNRPWLTRCGDRTLMHLAATRVRRIWPDTQLVYITPEGQGNAELAEAHRLRIPTFTTAAQSQITSIAEVITKRALSTVNLVPLFAGLPCAENIDTQIIEAHHSGNFDVTLPYGLYEGLEWQIYSARAVLWLAELADPNLPPRIKDLLTTVEFAHARTNTSIDLRIQRIEIADHPIPVYTSLSAPRAIAEALAGSTHLRCGESVLDFSRIFARPWNNVFSNAAHDGRRSSNLRVLFVSASSAYSGAEEALVTLVRALTSDEVTCAAVTSYDGFFARRLQDAGARVFCPNADISQVSLQALDFLQEVVAEVDPTVVHMNDLHCVAFGIMVRQKGIPVVQHIRTVCDDPRLTNALQVATRLVSVSHYAGAFLQKFPLSARVEVVRDPIDPVHFDPSCVLPTEARRPLGLRPDGYVIGCIARFAPNKNHQTLLEAFAQVAERVDNAQLLLVGDSDDPREFRQVVDTVQSLGISDDVVIHGFRSDIVTVHGAADVMVLCSVREPLGKPILEAMSMERAVVTSNCIGLSELVQDRINGRLVNPTSTNEIADVLIELVSPSTRTALGKRARHFVVENLSCEKISAQIARMYRDVLME